jgi:hypothetical protein
MTRTGAACAPVTHLLWNAGDSPFDVGTISISRVASGGSIPTDMGGRSNRADRIKLLGFAINRVVEMLQAEEVKIGTQTVDNGVSEGGSVKH